MRSVRRSALPAVTAILLFVTACSTGPGRRRAGRPLADLTVGAREYGFDVSAQGVRAGVGSVLVENRGREPHQAQLVRLRRGADLPDVQAAVRQDPTGTAVFGLGAAAGGAETILGGKRQRLA